MAFRKARPVRATRFDVSSPNVGYGFFSRFLNRAVDGKFDAVAFSTFTGDFNAATDFQLARGTGARTIALVDDCSRGAGFGPQKVTTALRDVLDCFDSHATGVGQLP